MLLLSVVPLNSIWSLNKAYAPFSALVNPSFVVINVVVLIASLGGKSRFLQLPSISKTGAMAENNFFFINNIVAGRSQFKS